MQIAIIDDEYAGRSELIYCLSQQLPEAEFTELESGNDALERFEQYLFDVAFIDMDLGDSMGNQLSKKLLRLQPQLKIVFATAFEDHAIEAFSIGVLDYLLKPFDPQRVAQCVERLQLSLPKALPEPRLAVHTDQGTVLLETDSILFIETQNRGCLIHTIHKDHCSNQTLSHYESLLSGQSFFRCHKSFLINLKQVTELLPWKNGAYSIKLRDRETQVPLSRGYVRKLKQALGL